MPKGYKIIGLIPRPDLPHFKRKPRKTWTPSRLEKLRRLYPDTPNRDIAARIGVPETALKSKATVLGLRKNPDYNRMSHSRMAMTAEEKAFIRENYQTMTNREIGNKLGRSKSAIQCFARDIGLKKQINRGCFPKGHVPSNKGLRQEEYMSPEMIERSKKTRFKKGDKPVNTKWDGAVTLRHSHKDRGARPYLWIRLAEGHWVTYHSWLWEQANGPVPEKHMIVFRNGNTMDTRLGNLECISMRENARRNANPAKSQRARLQVIRGDRQPKKLTDYYVAMRLAGGDTDLKDYLIKNHPDIIRIAKLTYELKRKIRYGRKHQKEA